MWDRVYYHNLIKNKRLTTHICVYQQSFYPTQKQPTMFYNTILRLKDKSMCLISYLPFPYLYQTQRIKRYIHYLVDYRCILIQSVNIKTLVIVEKQILDVSVEENKPIIFIMFVLFAYYVSLREHRFSQQTCFQKGMA